VKKAQKGIETEKVSSQYFQFSCRQVGIKLQAKIYGYFAVIN
jgi:hypothetical protein